MSMSEPVAGQCLCGGVRFRLNGVLRSVVTLSILEFGIRPV